MVTAAGFRARNARVLREAQAALNVAFGAILSAYVGNSLAEIDNHPFDHHSLARFFLGVALFILGLSLGNSVLLRGELALAGTLFAIAALGAFFGLREGRALGFEVAVLRVLSGCWIVSLLAGNVGLTAVNYLHHRKRT